MRFFRFLSLAVCLTTLISACRHDRISSGDLYSAVPQSSVLVLETHDIQNSLNSIAQTAIYNEIDSLPPMLAFTENLRSLKSSLAEDSLQKFFKSRPVLMTTTLSGAAKYNFLFITSGEPSFEKMAGRHLSRNYEVQKKTYSEAEIFHFYKKDKSKNYFISSYRGLLLFSTSGPLLEEAIRQMNSEYNIKKEPGFEKLYSTSNKKDFANLYVNLQELPGLLKSLLPLGDQEVVSRLGQWAEIDMEVKNKEVIMSGLILLPEDNPYYLQSFKNVSAQQTEGEEVVPASSGLWISQTFANADEYYRNYLNYLDRAGRLRKHEALLEKLKFDHEKGLLKWVDSEMGIFTTAGEGSQTNYVAYLKYRSEDDCRQALDSIANSDFIEGYRGVIIKKLDYENALPRFYGTLFKDFHYPYFIITNGFALFADNETSLKGVINDIEDGKTLNKDEEFNNFTANIPSESHLKVIVTNPGFLPYISSTLEGSDARIMEKFEDKLSHFRWAALQMNVDDQAAYLNFYMLHTTRKKERVARLWNVQLQSQAANTPQFLKNYVNHKYDVAVQDKDNRLYLIDYNGKILWTKNLDGPIMGNITQIDIYKNNKLQMVFNTLNSLYVVDRLGRDVENFPVKLKNNASAPVGVFNYDQARNYRLVVPEGPDLINYGVDGKEVKGWAYKKAKSNVISKPQHFTVNKKDVIVVLTSDGRLQELNRKGEKRFETVEDLPQLAIPFYLKEGESLSKSEILSIDPDGKLYAIRPGGITDKLFLDESNPADYFVYFDGRYVFTHDEKLFVKSDQNPWSAEMEADISIRPKVMIYGGDFYAGAYSAKAEEIRLFNKKGELIEGFPVFAQGPFDMGSLKQDGAINVVTYTEDGTLICYRVQ